MTNRSSQIFCLDRFDNLCWPKTPANQSITVSCARLAMQGVDPTKFLVRHCLPDGEWAPVSFEPCVYPDVWDLMTKFYAQRTEAEKKAYTDILYATRIIELVGLSVSFFSVLVSLLIFFSFKSLYCSRTKIHINLLLAIFMQIIARIVNYGIQMRQSSTVSNDDALRCTLNQTNSNTDISSILYKFCPLIVIFLQFSITSMFMWMLCEGIHLNNVLTVSVFKNHFKTVYFYILGWVVPFCITLTWSILMFIKEHDRKCWNNYNYLRYYWIIDGPRYAVMIINFIFLLNIIRVLVVKIKEGSQKQIRDEKEQDSSQRTLLGVRLHHRRKHRRGSMNTKFVRKAVKAAIFLLPLLGITHMLETFVSPDSTSIPLFALYCSVTYFLVTFQGFFCSLLYCFLNTEVRDIISRRIRATEFWSNWKRFLGNNESYAHHGVHSVDRTKIEMIRNSNTTTRVHLDQHRSTNANSLEVSV